MPEAATIGITVQQTRDAARNPSTAWVKLHRILCNRQNPTGTPFLPRLAGKVFRYVIFTGNKLIIRMLLLKQVQWRENSLRPSIGLVWFLFV